MTTLKEAAADFLAQGRIAVAGVSRRGDVAANFIYRRLRDTGHEVFAVNPNADEVEGDRCYSDLSSIPGGVGAVVIATHPRAASELVRECRRVGVRRVWLHRSFGRGSFDEGAVRLARELGLMLIPGGCPVMFCEPVDIGHRCMRWLLQFSGGLPEPVGNTIALDAGQRSFRPSGKRP